MQKPDAAPIQMLGQMLNGARLAEPALLPGACALGLVDYTRQKHLQATGLLSRVVLTPLMASLVSA